MINQSLFSTKYLLNFAENYLYYMSNQVKKRMITSTEELVNDLNQCIPQLSVEKEALEEYPFDVAAIPFWTSGLFPSAIIRSLIIKKRPPQ